LDPTIQPTLAPSDAPSRTPSWSPITSRPTNPPSAAPSRSPVKAPTTCETLIKDYKEVCEAEKKKLQESCGAKTCDECTRSDITSLQTLTNGLDSSLTSYQKCEKAEDQLKLLDGTKSLMDALRKELADAKDSAWLKAVDPAQGKLDCSFVPEDNCKRMTTFCKWDTKCVKR